jgi:hypothetical protein
MANSTDCLSAKIVLLHRLNKMPEHPSVNEINQSVQEQELHCRTLQLKHEISITQQLIFICAYSTDPFHVIATCIEETSQGGQLIIRLAANSGKHEVLLHRLSEISHILQNEALNSMIPLESILHATDISFC